MIIRKLTSADRSETITIVRKAARDYVVSVPGRFEAVKTYCGSTDDAVKTLCLYGVPADVASATVSGMIHDALHAHVKH